MTRCIFVLIQTEGEFEGWESNYVGVYATLESAKKAAEEDFNKYRSPRHGDLEWYADKDNVYYANYSGAQGGDRDFQIIKDRIR